MNTRVLIIEDDIEVVEKVKACDLECKGLELVDKLPLGNDKVSFLKELLPDIVILNFDTVHTDGIRLVEHIKKDMPLIKIILIIDSPNFEYAQKALNEWQVSYLIDKSQINKEILLKALDCVLKQLNIEKLNNSYKYKADELLKRLNELSLYILHEEVVAGAPENNMKMAEESLGVNLDFDTREFYLGFCGFNSKIYSHYIDGNISNDFFMNLRSKIRNINGAGYKAEIFMYATSKNFILIVSRDKSSRVKESVDDVIEEVHRLIQCEFEEKVIKGATHHQNFTVVSEKLSGLGDHIRDAFQNLIRLNQLSFFMAEQKIFKHEDIEALCKPGNIEYINFMLDHIKGALRSGQRAKLEHWMKILFIGTLKHSFNRSLCCYAVDYLKQVYITKSHYNEVAYEIELEKVFSIDEYTSIENICNRLCQIFSDLQNAIISKMGPKSLIIHGAISFIKQNYQNKISLKDISEYVCISPSYLCRIFKQETGDSLNQYIASVRVENAKKLLDDTDNKVWEICEKTGYPNPKYFSQVFKKIVGMSPQEYRERPKEVSEIG